MIKHIPQYLLTSPTFGQLFRFGIIGCIAASINFVIVLLLVRFTHMHPLIANIIAFLCAFQVSFFGHHYITFRVNSQKKMAIMLKFFLVSGLSFCLNESLYAIFLEELHLYYSVALALVLLIVPPVTFILSKLWAFR